ncbi:MAG: 6-carboxytetrahydropterin synthase [Nitrosopumilus sp.]|nr:6-carboxytetrahydropterin synthase [Nitrosopumilus sp.]
MKKQDLKKSLIRNIYPILLPTLSMRALCLITVKPGKVDSVVQILKKKRKIVKQIMVVTGRADISVILQGNIDEINGMVIDFKKIKDIVTTETLIEVEVNLGW